MLSAIIVPSPFAQCPLAIPDVDDVDMVRDWLPSHADVASILARIGGSKALGPDGISAAVLRVGGHVVLRQLHAIISASTSQCRFPVPWRGGIQVPILREALRHAQDSLTNCEVEGSRQIQVQHC